jgi:GH15 family glucan-1,4-alpha-glucosidase
MAAKIEDYGIVGDMQTTALISRAGSVDWLCAPYFDSDACFASLVGYDSHGRWAIRPTVPIREVRQGYEGDTLVLATEFVCEGGTARIVDFMPMNPGRSDLIRRVEGVKGKVPFEMVLAPRFGYGANLPWTRATPDGTVFTVGPDSLRLASTITTTPATDEDRAYFLVRAGDRVDFQLSCFSSHLPPPPRLGVEEELARTLAFWEEWAGRCAYRGRHREAVVRSLLTLKALTFAPTGAIVAAPTSSLPEEIGGSRNWDYRFCWLRDATLTLLPLFDSGYVEEARGFRDWLFRAIAGNPAETQIMYNIRGARRLTEFELPWLPGYEGSRPVRVGNAASDQFQLDVFGEVMNAIELSRRHGLPEMQGGLVSGMSFVRHVEDVWQRPDDGIWEVRGGRRHFTYSKVMAWVAFDRALRLLEEFGAGAGRAEARMLIPRLHALRERVHEEVCSRGYNPEIQAFTQSYGSKALDASVLLIPKMGFLPATDPRMTSTVAVIEKDLVRDGFVLRYSTTEGVDGLPGSEGAFLACSFWLVDNYALAGRIEEAEALFERLLGLRNHLGLLAEEYAPELRRQIGNFPQAFSHLALVRSATLLDAHARAGRAKPARGRAGQAKPARGRAGGAERPAPARPKRTRAPRGRASRS